MSRKTETLDQDLPENKKRACAMLNDSKVTEMLVIVKNDKGQGQILIHGSPMFLAGSVNNLMKENPEIMLMLALGMK